MTPPLQKPNKRSALFLCVSTFLVGGITGLSDHIYLGGWLVALLVSIAAVSWLPMNILALVIERRIALNPKKQFYQFYFGDLLFLPGAIACLAALQPRPGHEPYTPWLWFLTCILIGLAGGLYFHFVQDMPKPGGYTQQQWESPTKLWHDGYVFPTFIFLLLYRVPVIFTATAWTSGNWETSIIFFICLTLFFYMGILDGTRKPSPIATAHIDYIWGKKRQVHVRH